MRFKFLAFVAMCLSASVCQAVSVTVAESTYSYANGGLVTGTLVVSWPAFASGASSIAAGSTTVAITAGVLSVSLVANDTADPPVFYTATFRTSRGSYTQQWVVPSVAGPLAISDVTRVSLSPITILPSQISKVGAIAGDLIYYNGTNFTRLPVGTTNNGKVLSVDTSLAGRLKWITNSAGGGIWGGITGTLSDQTDLGTALALKLAKASNLSDLTSASTARTNLGLGTAAVTAASDYATAVHTHAAADTTSGVFAIARLATGTPTGFKFVADDGTLKVPAGGGNVSITSGVADPSGACTAGSDFYLQTTLTEIWYCAVSGTWKKFLSTTNLGTYVNVGLAGTAPSTPAAGYVSEYYDSTAKVPQSVDDAGNKSTMVRPDAGTTNQFMTGISVNGVPVKAQPTLTNLGAFAVNPQTGTYFALAADFAACKTITVVSGGPFAITLVDSATQPPNGQCLDVINYSTTAVSIGRSGQNINGGTAAIQLRPGALSSHAHIVSDGTNYFASQDYSNPFTTAGDMEYYTLTGPARLAVGSSSTVLLGGTTPSYGQVDSSRMVAANKTFVKSINLFDPVVGDSYRVATEFGQAVTLTRVSCNVTGGTNAVINLMKTTEATSESGGTQALTSDLTCTVGAYVASTTFSSAGVAARIPLALKITSVSGINTRIVVHIEGTID